MYKENVRISEALVIHMQEADKLRVMKDRLEKDLEEMSGEKDLNEMLVKEKVQESKHQKRMIKEVKERSRSLFISLTCCNHDVSA